MHSHEHHLPLRAAIWIALLFMLIEVVGGLIANSLALMTDALHLFTDVGAFALSLIALKIARRPRHKGMSYGYHRAEILGALASALSLWALSVVLIYEAVTRLITPEPVQGLIVFVVACIGLVANLLMMRVLHPVHKESLNVRAAYLHVLGDLLGSIGVIVGGLILWFTHWYLVDPIITILFTGYILYGSTKIVRETVAILMEATPPGIDPDQIQKELEAIAGVDEVHDLHIWSVTPNRLALSVHIISKKGPAVLKQAYKIIEKKYHIQHMTIQVEDAEHFDPKYCYDCQKNSSKMDF